MQTLYHLTTFKGIPIRLHYTCISAALLGGVVLMEGMVPAALPELGRVTRLALTVLVLLLVFLVVVIHEAAHLLVARLMGVPIPAINLYPLGALTRLPDRKGSPWAAFWMAAAGPAASLTLWLFMSLAIADEPLPSWLATTLGIAAQFSLFLGLLNLLPGLPLDGGRMLRAVCRLLGGSFEEASQIADRLGQVIAYGLILAGATLVLWRQDWLGGGAMLLIGWLLLEAAGATGRRAAVAKLLQRLTAADLLRPAASTLAPTSSLREAWAALAHRAGTPVVPVVDSHTFYGMISSEQVLAVPQGYWDSYTVVEVVASAATLQPVSPVTPVSMIIPRLIGNDVTPPLPVAVVEQGRLLGLIDAREMAEFLELEEVFGVLPHTDTIASPVLESGAPAPVRPSTTSRIV